jgi:hypothetical protein
MGRDTMIELELTIKQIYQLEPLAKKLIASAKENKPGMIIAQVVMPEMRVMVEFLPHEKSKDVIKAMKGE